MDTACRKKGDLQEKAHYTGELCRQIIPDDVLRIMVHKKYRSKL